MPSLMSWTMPARPDVPPPMTATRSGRAHCMVAPSASAMAATAASTTSGRCAGEYGREDALRMLHHMRRTTHVRGHEYRETVVSGDLLVEAGIVAPLVKLLRCNAGLRKFAFWRSRRNSYDCDEQQMSAAHLLEDLAWSSDTCRRDFAAAGAVPALFKMLDRDGSGVIDADELRFGLRKTLKLSASRVSDDDIGTLLRAIQYHAEQARAEGRNDEACPLATTRV